MPANSSYHQRACRFSLSSRDHSTGVAAHCRTVSRGRSLPRLVRACRAASIGLGRFQVDGDRLRTCRRGGAGRGPLRTSLVRSARRWQRRPSRLSAVPEENDHAIAAHPRHAREIDDLADRLPQAGCSYRARYAPSDGRAAEIRLQGEVAPGVSSVDVHTTTRPCPSGVHPGDPAIVEPASTRASGNGSIAR